MAPRRLSSRVVSASELEEGSKGLLKVKDEAEKEDVLLQTIQEHNIRLIVQYRFRSFKRK